MRVVTKLLQMWKIQTTIKIMIIPKDHIIPEIQVAPIIHVEMMASVNPYQAQNINVIVLMDTGNIQISIYFIFNSSIIKYCYF